MVNLWLIEQEFAIKMRDEKRNEYVQVNAFHKCAKGVSIYFREAGVHLSFALLRSSSQLFETSRFVDARPRDKKTLEATCTMTCKPRHKILQLPKFCTKHH